MTTSHSEDKSVMNIVQMRGRKFGNHWVIESAKNK